ncbi:MAG: hypothetical protein CMJ34_03860 [Phycisphaerae bacterium]|nr:hypothetical protein [Phycisphaerae bacterium]
MRRVIGFAPLAAVLMVVAGCASSPAGNASGLGDSRISILEGDRASRRYVLHVRDSDGEWFHGGGRNAMEGRAPSALSMTEGDRKSIFEAMKTAGWLDAEFEVDGGDGPRFLEVSIAGGVIARRFTMLAVDGRFDQGTESILAILDAIAERRFQGVLDALPRARPTKP